MSTYNYVFWSPPVGNECSFRDCFYLRPERRCEFRVVLPPHGESLSASSSLDVMDLFGEFSILGGVGPDIAPVLSLVFRISGADDFEHIL